MSNKFLKLDDERKVMKEEDIDPIIGDMLGGLSGATIRIPVLIEEKTLQAGATSATFSNLDGDNDKEYFAVFDLVTSCSGNPLLILKPNNSTSNQKYVNYRFGGDSSTWSGVSVNEGGSYLGLCFGSSSCIRMSGTSKIYAKTGVNRIVKTDSFEKRNTNDRYRELPLGEWIDTNTNITSLVFALINGTFSGLIKLYKIVDIEL